MEEISIAKYKKGQICPRCNDGELIILKSLFTGKFVNQGHCSSLSCGVYVKYEHLGVHQKQNEKNITPKNSKKYKK